MRFLLQTIFIVITCYIGFLLFAVKDEQVDVPRSIPMFRVPTMNGGHISDQDVLPNSVLYFFRSSCGYCLLEYPKWIQLRKKYPNVRMIAILHKESLHEARQFFMDHENPFDAVVADPHNQLWNALGAKYTPETFVIKDGKVDAHLGYMRNGSAILEQSLSALSLASR